MPYRSLGSAITASGWLILLIAGAAEVTAQTPVPIAPQWFEDAGASPVTMVNGREAVANEVLVKFRNLSPGQVEAVRSQRAIRSYRTIGRGEIVRMRSASQTVQTMMAELATDPNVEYVEPNYVIRSDQVAVEQIPNDPSFGEMWGLRNTGQTAGVTDADIDADEAWDVTTGSASIVVGVLDSGIDYDHEDLSGNVWSAPGAFSVTIGGQAVQCAAGTHGFNAITKTCDPRDDAGHGTHVSGTIGAVGNNGTGVTGINWTASLMSLKFLNDQGGGTTADVLDAIEFAIQVKQFFSFNGTADLRILSASWGGTGYSQALRDQIEAAYQAGIMFVASAGNTGADNDSVPHYPSDFDVSGLISVAATNSSDAKTGFSNYGSLSVDLGAPGEGIYSTTWSSGNSSYGYASGTSMATPHVSGAVALILSVCDLPPTEMKNLILATVDPLTSLSGKTVSGGRLNIRNALDLCEPQNPTFTMSVTPPLRTVSQDGKAVFQVDVRSWFGFSGDVSLSVGPLPGAFLPSIVPGGEGSSTLQVSITPANLGTHILTITASSGGIVRTRDIVLDVTGTRATPVPLPCGTTVNGALTTTDPFSELNPGAYHDRYLITTTAGNTTLFLATEDFSPGLSLLHTNGNLIQSAAARIWGDLGTGLYVVEVSSPAAAETGNYSLTLQCSTDPSGRDDIVVDFGPPYGIWIWKNDSLWVQLHQDSPEDFIVGDLDGSTQDEIVIDFGDPHGIWAWRNDTTWNQIHSTSAVHMAFGDHFGPDGRPELIVDFGPPYGIWSKEGVAPGGWWELTHLPSEEIVAGDVNGSGLDTLFVDAGASNGIEVFRNGFYLHQLHSYTPDSMAAGDLDGDGRDDLVVDFGTPWGIWIAENYSRWVQLHNITPLSMITADLDGSGQDDVVVDFGSPYGIWVWKNNSVWVQIHGFSPGTKMVAGDVDGSGQDDIVVDFGYPFGIYIWKNDTQWIQLHDISPLKMVVGDIDGS